MNSKETAIKPTRQDDYPEWYQQVIKAADLAENAPVRGCMVIKPWGYGIWERIQQGLDKKIKDLGHENAYFPLLIPLGFLEKEAEHVSGFAKECAVVTHHRLEEKNGKLVPTGQLEEPLIIRPTSETIIGEVYSRWVQSYRDLPLLINQWANVLRWEMRTRLFLRTSEFLWQEGHTVHESKECAMKETLDILEMYRSFSEDFLAMPVFTGEKPLHERFPGAVVTTCIEAMMQDRKALQAGTSHYLGQNFAKASDIKYLSKEGATEYAHTTSWGVSTRLIGGVIMTHGDDDGMKIPPKVAPKHVVVLPVVPKEELTGAVFEYAEKVRNALRSTHYDGTQVVTHIDKRDLRGGEKSWQWIKKGIPVRVEVGPRDIESGSVVLFRRDKGHKEKEIIKLDALAERIPEVLAEIQKNYLHDAKRYRDENTTRDIKSLSDFQSYFSPKNEEKPEIHGGFAIAKWSEDPATLQTLEKLKVTVRCMPYEQSGSAGKCVLSGKEATKEYIFAKAY